MRRIVTTHGIGGAWGLKDSNVGTMKVLGEELTQTHFHDFEVYQFTYGPRGWFTAEKHSLYDAEHFAGYVRDLARRKGISPQDIDIIGHSNGCRVQWRAMASLGLSVGNVLWLNPALNSNVNLSDCDFKSLTVLANKFDKAVWLGSIIPFHKFGLGGVKGFKDDEKDDRINVLHIDRWAPFSNNHNYLFNEKHLPTVIRIIAKIWKKV